jgi:hypothetical protein
MPIDHIIVPPERTRGIVKTATTVYLRACPCRARERACPREAWEGCRYRPRYRAVGVYRSW